MKKWTTAACAAALLVVLAACGSGGERTMAERSAGMATMNEGPAAPAFDLPDMNGNRVTLAGLAGGKVYVKFWASWCPICLAGMEELNGLAAQDNDFTVLTIVSPGFRGEMSEADFKEWFAALRADGTADHVTVLLDPGGKLAQQFGVRGYPTSAYIGSDGVLVRSVPGHNPNEAITETFDSIA